MLKFDVVNVKLILGVDFGQRVWCLKAQNSLTPTDFFPRTDKHKDGKADKENLHPSRHDRPVPVKAKEDN